MKTVEIATSMNKRHGEIEDTEELELSGECFGILFELSDLSELFELSEQIELLELVSVFPWPCGLCFEGGGDEFEK